MRRRRAGLRTTVLPASRVLHAPLLAGFVRGRRTKPARARRTQRTRTCSVRRRASCAPATFVVLRASALTLNLPQALAFALRGASRRKIMNLPFAILLLPD